MDISLPNRKLVLKILQKKNLNAILRNIIAFFVTYAFPFTDFGMPFEVPGAKKSSSFTPNEEALAMVMTMGFNTEQATKALKATVSKVVMSMIKYLVLFK